MKAMSGNTSKFASFSNLIKSFANLSESHQINANLSSNLLKFRVFGSFDGQFRNGQGKRNAGNGFNGARNDFDDRNKFSGRNRNEGNLSDRPIRGQKQNAGPNPDYRRQGRRNDGFSEPIGRDEDRASMKLSDEFFKSEEVGEVEGGMDYQPSVRELLNGPVRGEQRGGKEDGEFLERFKLGGVGKGDNRSNEVHTVALPEEEKVEKPGNADEIFSNMKKSGLIPNAVAMLDGLCKDGLVQEAMKLFGLMREKGTMPEVVVYTAVVDGFCQAHRLDDAKRIFKKMHDNGIVPNAFSYNVLIKGLCKEKRLEEAFDLCVEMLEAGHSPNVPTFTGLVHDFCNEKGVEDAQKMIRMLKQKGFFLDEKAVRVYLDKNGPTSRMVWEAIFGPKKTTQKRFKSFHVSEHAYEVYPFF